MLGCTNMSSSVGLLGQHQVRIFLMPRRMEPELATMQLKTSIHMGTKSDRHCEVVLGMAGPAVGLATTLD